MNGDAGNRQGWLGSGPNGCFTERAFDSLLSSFASPKEAAQLIGHLATSRPPHDSAHRVESELWRLVLTDKLTGLCNQQGFIALAEQQWRVARRLGEEMVFVGLELQSPVANGDRGRGGADLALMAAGRILTRCFRRSDVVCRWEGIEFRVLAVSGEGLDEPMLGERIRYQARISSGPAGHPLLFTGRLTRIQPRTCETLAGLLSSLNQELVQPGGIWSGDTQIRQELAFHETRQ